MIRRSPREFLENQDTADFQLFEAHHFSYRAGRPDAFTYCTQPLVSVIVPYMLRIDKGNQNIYIEEKTTNGNSSSNWRTNSDVTFFDPERTGKSNMPFRICFDGRDGTKDLRASEEITSPTLCAADPPTPLPP